MEKDKSFAIGYKRGMLKKQFKRQFGKGIFNKSEWLKKVLRDIEYFNEDVMDVLRIADPKTTTEVVNLVNAHLDLEYRMLKDDFDLLNEELSDKNKVKLEKKTYIVGEAKKCFGYENKDD